MKRSHNQFLKCCNATRWNLEFPFQVEAALTTTPDDPELLKLKKDLEEVIELTTELIKSQLPDDVKKDGE